MKPGQWSNPVLISVRLRFLSCQAFRGSFFRERMYFLKKFLGRRVDASSAFIQPDEGLETVLQAPLGLLIREAGKPAKVAPVGAGWIPSKSTRKFFCG
jgi:hypothetical protein